MVRMTVSYSGAKRQLQLGCREIGRHSLIEFSDSSHFTDEDFKAQGAVEMGD